MKYLIVQDETAVIFADNTEYSTARRLIGLPVVSYGDAFTKGNTLVISPKMPNRLQKDAEVLKALGCFTNVSGVQSMSDLLNVPHIDKRVYTSL